MLQCLNNVPPLLSHQHQKLQSSSHCFHCSTTCSPTHTHTHMLAHSLCDYPHLCSSQSPPPLSTLSISVTERIPPPLLPLPLSLFLSPSLHLPSLPSTPGLSLLSRLVCDAAHKVPYAAICAAVQHIRAIQKHPYALLCNPAPTPSFKQHQGLHKAAICS